jgi:uncharacterized membrane protein
MNAEFLRERVISLSVGLTSLGIGAELYAMSLGGPWGLYRYLKYLAEG